MQSRASHSLDTRFRNDTERIFRRQESIAAPGMMVARNTVGRFEWANRVDRYGGLKNLGVVWPTGRRDGQQLAHSDESAGSGSARPFLIWYVSMIVQGGRASGRSSGDRRLGRSVLCDTAESEGSILIDIDHIAIGISALIRIRWSVIARKRH